MLTAVPRVGQFNDPQSEDMLAKFLIVRVRDSPAVSAGREPNRRCATGRTNSGVQKRRGRGRRRRCPSGVRRAVAAVRQRHRCNDADRQPRRRLARARSAPAPQNLPAAAATYIRAEIAATGGPASWAEPVHMPTSSGRPLDGGSSGSNECLEAIRREAGRDDAHGELIGCETIVRGREMLSLRRARVDRCRRDCRA